MNYMLVAYSSYAPTVNSHVTVFLLFFFVTGTLTLTVSKGIVLHIDHFNVADGTNVFHVVSLIHGVQGCREWMRLVKWTHGDRRNTAFDGEGQCQWIAG